MGILWPWLCADVLVLLESSIGDQNIVESFWSTSVWFGLIEYRFHCLGSLWRYQSDLSKYWNDLLCYSQRFSCTTICSVDLTSRYDVESFANGHRRLTRERKSTKKVKSRHAFVEVKVESRDDDRDHEEKKVSSFRLIHVRRDDVKWKDVKALVRTFLVASSFDLGLGSTCASTSTSSLD